MQGKFPFDRDGMLERLKAGVDAFNQIPTRIGEFPKAGIVGEIYVKFNAFSNNRVAQWLTDHGIEVIVPPLLEFFAGWFVSSSIQVREHMRHYDLQWLLAKVLDRYVHKFLDEVETVRSRFKHYYPGHSIKDIANKAQEIVALTHQYGEGWLIAGEIGEMFEHGVKNVLCLQPFGCIANQVVAKGVEKRMKERFPGLNLLFLDLDAGVSEVNYFNRMHFFVDHARQAHSEP